MNRRELLAGSSVGLFLGVSGCIDTLELLDKSNTGDNTAENDVPECLQKETWTDDITSEPANAGPASIAGRRDCANANRPEPTGDVCATYEIEGEDGERDLRYSVGVQPYPNLPATLDEETLTSFVYEYERAYSHNSAVSKYGEHLVSVSVGVDEDETRVLDSYDEITVIRIEFGIGLRINRDEDSYYEDRLGEAAVYGVDETGIVRAGAEYDEDVPGETPDPVEDGSLLECF